MKHMLTVTGIALLLVCGPHVPLAGKAADESVLTQPAPAQSVAEQALRKAAADGDSTAQYNLALALLKPIPPQSGLVKEGAEAAAWLKKSAEQGNVDAAYMLGFMHQYETGVAKDVGKSLTWMTRAADAGHVTAMVTLAIVYKMGDGVIPNKVKARDYYAKAAEKGNNNARTALGIMYRDGDGVHRDGRLAFGWLKRAVNDGHAPAMLALGKLYAMKEPGMLHGPKALYWTHRSIAHGYAPGILALGTLYRDGVGTIPPDPYTAYLWLKLACELSGRRDEQPYWMENAARALDPVQRKKADAEVAVWLRQGPPAPPAREPQ